MDSNRVNKDINRPYAPKESSQKNEIDPEKFKTVMKVDESDETQKRHKRQLKKEDEEGEDEKTEERPGPKSGVFSELMEHNENLDNILQSKSGGIQKQVVSNRPPPTTSILTNNAFSENSEMPPPEIPASPTPSQQAPSRNQTETRSTPPPAQPVSQPSINTEAPIPQSPPVTTRANTSPAPTQLSQPTPQNSPEDSSQEAQTPVNQPKDTHDKTPPKEEQPVHSGKHTKKKKKSDASLLASQPALHALKKKKTVKKPPPKRTRSAATEDNKDTPAVAKKSSSTTKTHKTASKQTPSSKKHPTKKTDNTNDTSIAGSPPTSSSVSAGAPDAKGSLEQQVTSSPQYFRKLTPQQARAKRVELLEQLDEAHAADAPVSPAQNSDHEQKDQQQQRHKEPPYSFLEATPTTASIPLPSSNPILTSIQPTATTPAYSKLSPDLYELFEKMGGVMSIQQHGKDSTTTLYIDNPNSPFYGSQVILDRYSTAPNAFNLQLVSKDASTIQLFQEHLQQLNAAFKESQYSFEVNILPPRGPSVQSNKSRKSSHVIHRKGAAGDKGGSDQDSSKK